MLSLLIEQVQDPISRENFLKVNQMVQADPFQKSNFKFFEITFTKAETNKKLPHSLGFLPKDIIQTSLIGAGTVTWNYTLFDSTNLNITTSAACVVRAFIGRYGETGA